MASKISIQPSLKRVEEVLQNAKSYPNPPNLIPICASIGAEFLQPSALYLKITARAKSKFSFLYESAAITETIGRYSFIGTDPRKVIATGPGYGECTDPLPILEKELSQVRVAHVPELFLPSMTGGAIGYVGYDCVQYFEPRTKRTLKDVLKVPESLFMFFDTIVAFDHFYQKIMIITYVKIPTDGKDLNREYMEGEQTIRKLLNIIKSDGIPLPSQGPIETNQQYTSNIGQAGYEQHVLSLKKRICKGDIIQAVPSQRISRPTSLHPFNIYRHLRTVNPSPYLFYVDCDEFQIVGASPELLVKSDAGRILTHPIAGTVKRGNSSEQDEVLAGQLRDSIKDRAEHVMLVDLARNDVNRVCDPLSTRVDYLMVVQKFSHVQHLVSQVSGTLRPDKTRFDAFRSIFPAGTVSGAPKVKAMELIAELEGEKRGLYAGAVGYFGYDTVSEGVKHEGTMDTCIALRTMVVKGGVAYLQAGGGIVFDSDPLEEYEETINKLNANIHCISTAEQKYIDEPQLVEGTSADSTTNGGGVGAGAGAVDGHVESKIASVLASMQLHVNNNYRA